MCYKCQVIQLSIPPADYEAELKRIAKLIREGKLQPGQIDKKMTAKIAKQLMAGVNKGYGASKTSIEASFLAQVEQSIFVFSGFKNYQMLKEASLLLKDGDTLKPFKDFLNDIKAINSTYNELYAAAEYSNAVASMQAAASWNDFIANGVDMLRFQTAGDDRVRTDHAILDGTTVEITDPLLDKYYTPLDWGCRCEWVPAIGESRKVNTDLPVIPPMFSTNVAKTGIIFPDTHPYFNVKPAIANAILKQVDEVMVKEKVVPVDRPPFYPDGLDDYKKSLGIEVKDDIFTYLKEPIKFTNIKGDAYYAPLEKRVNITISARIKASKWTAERTIYHEFGHAADWQHGYRRKEEVTNLMDKYRSLFRKNKSELYESINAKLRELSKQQPGFYGDINEQIGATADTLMALNSKYGWGHSPTYFKRPYMKEAEFIAHAFENKISGNPIFKELMPDLYNDMIKMLDELKKSNK